MDKSDFIADDGVAWRIFTGLPDDYPETGDRTMDGRSQAGLTFRASTGEVRVLPRAAIPHRVYGAHSAAPLGTKRPTVQPETPSWRELLTAALPWPHA